MNWHRAHEDGRHRRARGQGRAERSRAAPSPWSSPTSTASRELNDGEAKLGRPATGSSRCGSRPCHRARCPRTRSSGGSAVTSSGWRCRTRQPRTPSSSSRRCAPICADNPVDGVGRSTPPSVSRGEAASRQPRRRNCSAARTHARPGKARRRGPGGHLRRGEDGAQEQLLQRGRRSIGSPRSPDGSTGPRRRCCEKRSTTCSRSCADPHRTMSPTIRLRGAGRTSRASPGTPRAAASAS